MSVMHTHSQAPHHNTRCCVSCVYNYQAYECVHTIYIRIHVYTWIYMYTLELMTAKCCLFNHIYTAAINGSLDVTWCHFGMFTAPTKGNQEAQRTWKSRHPELGHPQWLWVCFSYLASSMTLPAICITSSWYAYNIPWSSFANFTLSESLSWLHSPPNTFTFNTSCKKSITGCSL